MTARARAGGKPRALLGGDGGVAIEVVRAGREPDAFWDMFDEGL